MAKKQNTVSKMHGMEVRPDELYQLLMNIIPQGLPSLIVGKPGIGKTDIVTQVARDLDFDLKVIHPVVADPTDVKGMPFVYKQEGSKQDSFEARWFPFGDLKDLIEADRPMIVFLDDLGQASPMVQASYMQLLLFRSINEHKVSDHVTFVAATNRKEDRAGVSGILEPVKSRFATILHLEVSYKDWLSWAAAHDINPELIGFVNWKATVFDDQEYEVDIINQPSPRTISHVDKLLKCGLSRGLEQKAFAGAAGPAFATEFMAYLKVFRDLPDPEKALKDPDSVEIPGPERADIAYALCASVAHRVTEKTFPNMIRLVEKMGPEYCVMAAATATQRDPKLKKTPAFRDWAAKNAHYINA